MWCYSYLNQPFPEYRRSNEAFTKSVDIDAYSQYTSHTESKDAPTSRTNTVTGKWWPSPIGATLLVHRLPTPQGWP
ncbi:hypothetical protein FKM82_019520 [Ascaphus truei]